MGTAPVVFAQREIPGVWNVLPWAPPEGAEPEGAPARSSDSRVPQGHKLALDPSCHQQMCAWSRVSCGFAFATSPSWEAIAPWLAGLCRDPALAPRELRALKNEGHLSSWDFAGAVE